MKNNLIAAFAVVAACASAQAEVIRPTGFDAGKVRWQELGNKTDDFESGSLNPAIWQNAPASLNVGAWTFDANNAYVQNGRLNIEVTQETHTRSFQDSCWDGVAGGSSRTVQRELYYKSGAVRTAAEGVYGFYEAKIKGVDIFPGLSPAFWLYSDGHPFPDRNDPTKQYVDYSEIDVVELQQADWRSPTDFDDVFDMDHNLHARVEENGQIVWKRPKPNPEAQLLHYEAPFDPSKDFHTYAVENRPDRISWYVDGVLVGSKPNKWWHRPMHVIFSMGLRRHLIRYNPDCQRADPNPDNVISEGFPERATMQVEYLKTWQALPSIWLDDPQNYTSTSYQAGSTMDVTVNYHGGSNHYVVADKYNGITVNLVERNANGVVAVVASANDASVSHEEKRYAGQTVISLNLAGVTPTSQLPNGHYYALAPVFRSSNGSDIFLQNAITNINITNGNYEPVTGVNIAPTSISLNVGETYQLSASVLPNNASNKNVTWYSYNDGVVTVDPSGLVTAISANSTQVEVTTVDGGYTDSVTFNVNGNQSPSDLLSNPGFEEGNLMTTWDASYGNSSIVTNNARTGNRAGYLNGNGALQQFVDVTPNTTYTLTGWGKVSANGQDVFMGVSEYGGATQNALFTSTNYQQRTITFTTGATNTSAKIWFWNGDANDRVYADDFVLTSEGGTGTVSVTGVSLSDSSINLEVGGTRSLLATVLPSNATNKNVTWSSTNNNVATVNNGVVTAESAGTATIRVTTQDGGHQASASVNVSGSNTSCSGGWVSVTGVNLTAPSQTVADGQTLQLSAQVLPACASNKNVTYSSSNTSVAIVNSSGLVTARNPGTAVITVRTKNMGRTDTMTITVTGS
ncbi:Ig-like domain-containing protein [Saccharobesus litoralis]|nr:Ig-like domain-containing protein [Saccharobesus litoralis]